MPLEKPSQRSCACGARPSQSISSSARASRRRLDAPETGDELEIFQRRELVVDHRLVRHPGHDALGGDRIVERVDAERPQIEPASGRSRPATMRSVVVLPAPFGPSRHRTRRRARSGRGRRPPAGRSSSSARGRRGRQAGDAGSWMARCEAATLVERGFSPVNQKITKFRRFAHNWLMIRKGLCSGHPRHLDRDDYSSNRHPDLVSSCLSMIFSENRFHFSGSCFRPAVRRRYRLWW